MGRIAVLGTLDTKGHEHAFVAACIRQSGHVALLIDVGVYSDPTVVPDICRETILQSTILPDDRGSAVKAMAEMAAKFIKQLQTRGEIDAVIALGGSGGTAIASAVMRALPLGVPKVLVSTLLSGNVAPFIGQSDIVMVPSIVDVAGLNSISRAVFARAATAVCAMVDANDSLSAAPAKPLIVASMFGNTTRCVEFARQRLEEVGFEVLVFHATGNGGRCMESLVESGLVSGVLDVTTTEWADELVGGTLSAGPARLDAAALNGIPAVVAPGCLDIVNFGELGSIPPKFAGRRFYQHSPQITLMRTTEQECMELGKILADKLNASVGAVSVLIPTKAISVISAPGQPFHDPAADRALFESIRKHLRRDIECRFIDCEINDPQFAQSCVDVLLENIRRTYGPH